MFIVTRAVQKLSIAVLSILGDRVHKERITKNTKSLLHYRSDLYSETGQDGILEEILKRIGISSGTFIEFGAWDGIHLSNCRRLLENGWKGVLIEANSKRAQECVVNSIGYNCKVLNMVMKPSRGWLSKLLRDVGEEEVALLSIDIDGMEHEFLQGLDVRPSVIVIEGGSNLSPYLPRDVKIDYRSSNYFLQQSLPYLCGLADSLGYKSVAFYQDLFLVRKDIGHNFEEYSAVDLFDDYWQTLSKAQRVSIMILRMLSRDIKRTERRVLGKFRPSPMLTKGLGEC